MTYCVRGCWTLFLWCCCLLIFYLIGMFPVQAGSGEKASVILDVERDESVTSVAQSLEDLDVIAQGKFFVAYLRLLGKSEPLKHGSITLRRSMTPEDVAKRVAYFDGPAVVRVTFPEGFDSMQMADRLSKHGVCATDDFLQVVFFPPRDFSFIGSPTTLEGYLFPDTYNFRKGEMPERIVARMVRQFRVRLGLGKAEMATVRFHPASGLSWSLHELVTLASIVEKEVRYAPERERVAGVFVNRLTVESFQPRLLQADPTVGYGCRRFASLSGPCSRFSGVYFRDMLRDRENPFNTYVWEGLPPGPICNPGLASIRAAMSPDQHEFLYFVADRRGRHRFSKDLKQHNEAVRQYRRRNGSP